MVLHRTKNEHYFFINAIRVDLDFAMYEVNPEGPEWLTRYILLK